MFLSAPFADGALVTPPALLKDHLGHPYVDAVGMVALTTLGGTTIFSVVGGGGTRAGS